MQIHLYHHWRKQKWLCLLVVVILAWKLQQLQLAGNLIQRQLRVIAELRQGDLFHSTNVISSIEFDIDDEFFATAGVSRPIKVFEFSSNCGALANVRAKQEAHWDEHRYQSTSEQNNPFKSTFRDFDSCIAFE